MLAAALVIGLTIVVFIGFGVVLHSGRGAFLIAGYNSMPQEKKEKYDTVGMCKFMGKMMFALSFSMVFWIFSVMLDKDWLFAVGLALFMGIVIYMITYMNTGNRFKK